jgi:hypothetical protein
MTASNVSSWLRSNCRFSKTDRLDKAACRRVVAPRPGESDVQAAERAHQMAVQIGRPVTLALASGSVEISPSDLMFFHRGAVVGGLPRGSGD